MLNGKSLETDEVLQSKPLQWEQIVINLISRFVHVEKEKPDDEIKNALKQIGIYSGIDRAYIFLYDHKKREVSKTHEWCNKGIKKEIHKLKRLPVIQFPWWYRKITNNETINLSRIEDLPEEASSEKNFLKAQSIVSLLVVPVFYSGKAAGFIGFDTVRDKKVWSESEIKLLQVVAEIFGNTFKRIELTRQINHQNKQLKQLVELRTQEKDKLLHLNNSIVNVTSAMVFSPAPDLRDKKEHEKYNLMQKDLGFVLASTSLLDEGLQQVLEYGMKIEGIKAVGIYLFNPDTRELEYRKSIGLSDRFINQAQKVRGLQSFAFRKILQKGDPVYSKYTGILKYSKIFKDENLLQIGVIPIKYGDMVIGSFNIGSTLELKTLIKNVLETVASQVGGALWRINTQQKLMRNKKNFKLLFETIDDFVFIVNANGKIIKTNPVAESRLGYSSEELQQMTLIDLFSDTKKKISTIKDCDIFTGRISSFSASLFTKTGEEIPSETRIVFGEWDGEKVLIGVSRDISERLKTEEQLRRSEASWQFALDSFADGMWEYDIKNGKIKYSNQYLRLSGYNHDQITSTIEEWESVIHPEDIENVRHNMELHLQGKSDFCNIEYRILCKDSTYKWVLDRGKVISRDKKGNPLKMIGINIDISLQKKIENTLLMNLQKEKEFNEMKSQFVYMASHEFRTPLSTMLMATDSLGAYWGKMSEKEINRTIAKIKSNIQFLKNIIEKTLNFTHLESGKLKLAPVKTELNRFLIKSIEELRAISDIYREINYTGSDTPVNISIDIEMLKVVIMNLLSNSIKYSGSDTTVDVQLYRNNSRVIIEVTDKGIGIPEADKENVFKPFLRCSNINNIHGTGLGLALALKIVRLHGGDITFKSKINEGTTFFVSLPAN